MANIDQNFFANGILKLLVDSGSLKDINDLTPDNSLEINIMAGKLLKIHRQLSNGEVLVQVMA